MIHRTRPQHKIIDRSCHVQTTNAPTHYSNICGRVPCALTISVAAHVRCDLRVRAPTRTCMLNSMPSTQTRIPYRFLTHHLIDSITIPLDKRQYLHEQKGHPQSTATPKKDWQRHHTQNDPRARKVHHVHERVNHTPAERAAIRTN
jgi:hypothetical protein